MKLNPLSDALLKKSTKKPQILASYKEVHFEPLEKAKSLDEIAQNFPHTSNSPYLKLKIGSKKQHLPKKIGVLFSGGQAPGGHNVIWGLFDALTQNNNKSILLGFLDGPKGFLEEKYIQVSKEVLDHFRNLGGFNMLGSGRTKISTKEQLNQALHVALRLKLDGLVIIGGDDSNTNAAVLAEYFKKHDCKTAVVGVPKTIDGDLQNDYIEISFGFDTACKLYSELIGNILTDILSSKKYYHFIKLMGRSASHIALECALQTKPNMVLIGEEILENKTCLTDIVKDIADMVIERSKKGKNYGAILIPEGLIDFIPSFKVLIQQLNDLLAHNSDIEKDKLVEKLTSESKDFFKKLPENIQNQLLLDRDPHGNVQLAKIETHKLLMDMTIQYLKEINFSQKLNGHTHYFGYEGRCAHPTCFDAEYTYALGASSALLIQESYSGYMACVKNLNQDAHKWDIFGIPITSLMNIEHRHGEDKPVIKKALVKTQSSHFKKLQQLRDKWRIDDCYNAPGPIQYFGSEKISDNRCHLLDLL